MGLLTSGSLGERRWDVGTQQDDTVLQGWGDPIGQCTAIDLGPEEVARPPLSLSLLIIGRKLRENGSFGGPQPTGS